MSKTFVETEKQILLGTHSKDLGALIHCKGWYLRQLANSVICGNLSVNAASRLLLNY